MLKFNINLIDLIMLIERIENEGEKTGRKLFLLLIKSLWIEYTKNSYEFTIKRQTTP